MRFLHRTIHHEQINRKKLLIVNILSFMMGVSSGLLIYVISSYFKILTDTQNIGWIYASANIILIIVLFNIQKVVRLINKTTLFHFITITKITLISAVIILSGTSPSILALIGYIVFEALSWVILSMILESYAIDKDSGKIYGINLTMTNSGFIIAPILSTQLLVHGGFISIFYTVAILTVLIFLFAYFTLHHTTPLRFTKNLNIRTIFQELSQRPNITRIISISFVLEFFFAIMVIYTPLYLINAGFTWIQIGNIFTFMLIPFLIVEYPVGFLTDKKHDEKILLFIAFIIISSTSLLLYKLAISSLLCSSLSSS